MGKRASTSDPCARPRKRLADIDKAIADINDRLNDPGIPPAMKQELRRKLPALLRQDDIAANALATCLKSHSARTTAKRKKSKGRKKTGKKKR